MHQSAQINAVYFTEFVQAKEAGLGFWAACHLTWGLACEREGT